MEGTRGTRTSMPPPSTFAFLVLRPGGACGRHVVPLDRREFRYECSDIVVAVFDNGRKGYAKLGTVCHSPATTLVRSEG